MATEIKGKPENILNFRAPGYRQGTSYEWSTLWDLTDWQISSDNPNRCECVDVWWDLHMRNRKSGKTKAVRATQVYDPPSRHMTATLNLFGVITTEPKRGEVYNRASYYPFSDWLLYGVVANAHARNAKGAPGWIVTSAGVPAPLPPTVSDLEQDEGTGRVSCTVANVSGDGGQESIWAHWELTVADSRTNNGAPKLVDKGEYRESGAVSYDVADRMGMDYGDWVRVSVSAHDCGVNGDSSSVSKELYVSWPNVPSVGEVGVSSADATSTIDPTGKVTVPVQLNGTREHPATGVKLQKLVNVTYDTASEIPGDADWVDVGARDDGTCVALSVLVADVLPDAGKRTWVRVKAWNQLEGIFSRYSAPVRLVDLERPAATPTDDPVRIVSAIPGADGRSAEVQLVWAPSGTTDDSTGTEVAWSESEHAWRSNKKPDTYAFEWSDGAKTVGGTSYQGSALVHLDGLDEGTAYHVRARRYLETDEGTTYGAWYPEDSTVTVTPSSAPSGVTLVMPSSIAEGADLAASWTFDSDATQTEWELICGTAVTSGSSRRIDESAGVLVLDRGVDSMGSCVVPASTLAKALDADGHAELAVRVSTGGEMVTSDAHGVTVAVPPTVGVTAADITAQPLSLTLSCNVAARVAVVVTSMGVAGMTPTGMVTQPAGDAVWSASIIPAWVSGAGGYTATVTAPETLDLRNNGIYRVSVVATDRQSGLESEPAEATVTVEWARRALEPTFVTVTPSDVTDADGIRTLSARITLPSSASLADGDSYGVWAVTPDGVRPVAEVVTPGSVVTDHWAPYGGGSMAYRVAVRTTDGDMAWRDYAYELGGTMLRVDFGSQYVELPYNIAVSDGREKSFEARRKLDGSVDGYWGDGTVRKLSLTADTIRDADAETRRLVDELGRHAGSVIVRTPDGCRFEADVQMGSVSTRVDSSKAPVTLSATEVAWTGAYAATIEEAS